MHDIGVRMRSTSSKIAATSATSLRRSLLDRGLPRQRLLAEDASSPARRAGRARRGGSPTGRGRSRRTCRRLRSSCRCGCSRRARSAGRRASRRSRRRTRARPPRTALPTSGSTIAKPRFDDHATRQPGEIGRRARRRSEPAGGGKAGAVARVGAGHHVEQQRGVGDGRREESVHGVLRELRAAERRDAAVVALQADQTGEARGRADRTAAVARRAERHHARRHRGRRAAARTARRARRIPRVARHAEQRARGVRPRAELGRRGLADRDRAGGAQPADVDRVGRLRRIVREPARTLRRRHARAVLEVLHAERHAGQRPELVDPPVAHRGVDRPRRVQRGLGVDVHERVERGIVTLDRVEARGRSAPRPSSRPARIDCAASMTVGISMRCSLPQTEARIRGDRDRRADLLHLTP